MLQGQGPQGWWLLNVVSVQSCFTLPLGGEMDHFDPCLAVVIAFFSAFVVSADQRPGRAQNQSRAYT